jgi:GMP synthase-like glutamine amidotransferase
MNVLALINHEDAPLGVFADEIRARGHALDSWLPSSGEPLPRPLSDYGAVIALGGGMQADEDDRHPWLRTALDVLRDAVAGSVPTLGVCLGGQMLARATGGRVSPSLAPECGWEPIELTDAGLVDPLFAGRPRAFEVFQWHSYAFGLPPGAELLASNGICLQGFRIGSCAWGLQWHPEVTADSIVLWVERYPMAAAGAPGAIDPDALRADVAARIEETNADGRALCARFLELAGG